MVIFFNLERGLTTNERLLIRLTSGGKEMRQLRSVCDMTNARTLKIKMKTIGCFTELRILITDHKIFKEGRFLNLIFVPVSLD